MKFVKFISLFLVLSFWLGSVGCVDDSVDAGLSHDAVAPAVNRVIAKDYQVLAASREKRQCRHQPARNAEVLFSLMKGQKISLLSVAEQGRRIDGDLWLHVYVKRQKQTACFVLAEVLAPIGSRPIIIQ